MNLLVLLVLAAGFAVAFVNGANDVSKGIATLVGSGVCDLRRATRWGSLCTGLGGLAGAVLGGAMIATFAGGLLAASSAATPITALATLLGAAGWILFATRSGLPVSTTHALVGGIAGAGIAAYGLGAMNWQAIGGKLVLPLLLSPVVSFVLTATILRFRRRAAEPVASADCLCADVVPAVAGVAAVSGRGAEVQSMARGVRLEYTLGHSSDCPPSRGRLARLTVDQLHWASSGATSFARGLHDGPKMAALVLGALALTEGSPPGLPLVFAVITLGMVAGSLVGGQRVTSVLARDVTPMDHQEGLVANATTAALVTAGAISGLPMSTTHVSSTAIIGVGLSRGAGSLNTRTLRELLIAWLVTAPVAALLALACFFALSRMIG
jgi:PiT family inorganic phosphate transporter